MNDAVAGSTPYDRLNRAEQAAARSAWAARMTELRESLDLEAEFRATGQDWVDASSPLD